MMPFIPEKMQYWSENHQIGWMTGNRKKLNHQYRIIISSLERIILRILILIIYLIISFLHRIGQYLIGAAMNKNPDLDDIILQ